MEYESTLAQRTQEREAAEKRARELNEKYKKAKEKLDQDLMRGNTVLFSYGLTILIWKGLYTVF